MSLEDSPLTMIAWACNMAEEGVFFSSDFPIFVRDECYKWVGRMHIGDYHVTVSASTLDELKIKMDRWYEEIARKDRNDETIQQEVEGYNEQADIGTDT